MPISSGKLPTHSVISSNSSQQPVCQKKVPCFSKSRSITLAPANRYFKQSAAKIVVSNRLLKDRQVRLASCDTGTLNRLKQDGAQIRKNHNQRFLALYEKVKLAKSTKALEPILLEVKGGKSFGTCLSGQQKQLLLDAIELKNLDLLPAVPTEKPSPSKTALGKYVFSEAQQINRAGLKELAIKASGEDALLFFKDIGAGAFDKKLKVAEKNEIRLILLPKIKAAQNTANQLFSSLKAKLLNAADHRQVLKLENQLLLSDSTKFMSAGNLRELRSLAGIAKSRFKP